MRSKNGEMRLGYKIVRQAVLKEVLEREGDLEGRDWRLAKAREVMRASGMGGEWSWFGRMELLFRQGARWWIDVMKHL